MTPVQSVNKASQPFHYFQSCLDRPPRGDRIRDNLGCAKPCHPSCHSCVLSVAPGNTMLMLQNQTITNPRFLQSPYPPTHFISPWIPLATYRRLRIFPPPSVISSCVLLPARVSPRPSPKPIHYCRCPSQNPTVSKRLGKAYHQLFSWAAGARVGGLGGLHQNGCPR